MEEFITDERTGLKYKLVGDYYLVTDDDEPEKRPIGIWGQRHLRYLKQHRKTVYTELLTSGRLNGYLANLNEEAEKMFSQLVNELAKTEGITEKLKEADQMEWVRRMNTIREIAIEFVQSDIVFQ